jgi:transcriptional regulator with XRE-family HTH domain
MLAHLIPEFVAGVLATLIRMKQHLFWTAPPFATLRRSAWRRKSLKTTTPRSGEQTNVSLLERGGTSPTLDKLEELCSALGIHPVSLVAACYMRKENTGDIRRFLSHVEDELQLIGMSSTMEKEGRCDI